MKRLATLITIAFGLIASSASAAGVQLTPAQTGTFPERAYLLTLPSKAALSAGQVSLSENGAPVGGISVTPSKAVGEGNFGTVLVIDTNQTMQGATINSAMAAARAFAQYRNPQQPLGVVTFDTVATTALPLTTDPTAINRVLSSPPTLGPGAHIYSAVSVALQMLAQAHKIAGTVILLSDGAQSGSLSLKASVQRKQQVVGAAQALNVHVYAIGVNDKAFRAAPLQEIATAAGGSYAPAQSASLNALLRQLGAELSNQYLIRYRSQASLGSAVHVLARVAGQPGTASSIYTAPSVPIAQPAAAAKSKHTAFLQSTTAAILACALVALLLGVAAAALLAPRRNVRERVGSFVSTAPQESTKSWTGMLLARAFAEDAKKKDGEQVGLVAQLELARIGLSLPQILALTALGTVVLGWLLISVTASPLAAVLALSVPIAVRLAIGVRVDRERRSFDEQLPDNLQVIASAMRAGHTFVGALALVAEEAPEPSRRELKRVMADEQLGVPLGDALNAVTVRMNSRDFEHVALVAALQRETGGNTAEVIDSVTETIRERLDLRRFVRALTAQGRITGWVVSSLPIVLLIGLSLINPHYAHPLFHRTAGLIALGIGGLMLFTGFMIIRRIVNIKI
jgi:tight adherence protein B